MEVASQNKRHPALRAANAARVLGIIISLLGLLVIGVGLFSLRGGMSSAAIMLAVSLVYLAPGVALLVLAGGTRQGRRGPTIAVLVLAIIIAGYLWLGTLSQLFLALRIGGASTAMLIPLGFMIVIALVATLLSIYCIQSLRLPDLTLEQRGFEAIPVAQPVDEPTGSNT